MSNTDKLEELVNSGDLTLRYSHKSEKKMTANEWYQLYLKKLIDRSYEKEELLTVEDYLQIAEKLGMEND